MSTHTHRHTRIIALSNIADSVNSVFLRQNVFLIELCTFILQRYWCILVKNVRKLYAKTRDPRFLCVRSLTLSSYIFPPLHHASDVCWGSVCVWVQSLVWHFVLMFAGHSPNFHQRENPSKPCVTLSLTPYCCSENCSNKGIPAYPLHFFLRWSKEGISELWEVLHCSVVSYDLTWAPHWLSLLSLSLFMVVEVIQILYPVESPEVSVSAGIK